jgi:hypothetical protein
MAWMVTCGSRWGSSGRQRLWSAGVPCTTTSGGPVPLLQEAIWVPSRDTTRIMIGSWVRAMSALLPLSSSVQKARVPCIECSKHTRSGQAGASVALPILSCDVRARPPGFAYHHPAPTPGGELEVVDGGGHLVWYDDPSRIGARVARFLAG